MSDSRLTILAVDDETPPLEDLARILRANPRVREVDLAGSAQEAIVKASSQRYDAIFLDVRMPELDGLELARVMGAFATPPAVVFVSAFDTSAVAAFELRAVDYLMKPVTPQRVNEALERVTAARAATPILVAAGASGRMPEPDPPGGNDLLAVDNARSGGTRLLPRSSILYLKAYGDYMRVFSDSGRYLVRGRLTDAQLRLQPHGFVRVHRQYLANLPRAVEVRPLLNGTAVLRFADGSEVPVARRHVPELRRRLRA